MKKLLLILFVTILLSCSRENKSKEIAFHDIKIASQSSKKSGTIIKEKLEDSNILFFSYPAYSIQSYELLKFISGIMSKEHTLTVIYPSYPQNNENKDTTELIREQIPMLGFIEFIDLIDFFDKWNISFSGELPLTINENERLLILAPEHRLNEIKNIVTESYKNESIIKVIMPGPSRIESDEYIIESLPESKKISSHEISDSWFDIIMYMGLIKNYKPVTAIELYNSENFLIAPESFKELNSSIIESIQVNKMNNYLNKQIMNSFSQIGE